jgi:hypothetical protein
MALDPTSPQNMQPKYGPSMGTASSGVSILLYAGCTHVPG